MVDNIEACDEVWTVSRGAAANLQQLGFSGEIIQMENGVDFDKGMASDSLCETLRKEHEIPSDTIVFLFVGRMMWYKGIHIILDGLKVAFEKGSDFRMVFVGGGADMPEIKQEAERLGLAHRCVFVGPVHDRQKIVGYYSMADLFLFPSTYDTNGIVVREAAACGLASVLIRGSCAAEGITDGRNGILIDENAVDLANEAILASSDCDKLRSIGEHAKSEIYLSWEDSVKKAVERYEIVLDNHRAGKKYRLHKLSDGMIFNVAHMQELLGWLQSKNHSDIDSWES